MSIVSGVNMQITKEIAERVANTGFKDLSPEDIAYTKTLAMSALGAMVAGPYLKGSEVITRYVKRAGGNTEATVFGASGFKTCVEMAALANGTFAHATEYEDDSFPEAVSSYTLFPPIFALGEQLGSDGRAIIEALVLGYEAQARIGIACRAARKLGYMVLSLAGSIGCAVAASKLLGLDAQKTANAISIAASQASGIGYQTGTEAHVVEMGFPARNGLTAAYLAADGFGGKRDILEAPRGLFNIITANNVEEPERILTDWGKPYRIHEIGIKFYPCCYHLQRLIEETLSVRSQFALGAADIEEIECHVNAFFPTVVQHPEPSNEIEAQFSLPHVLSIAMIDGDVLPEGFSQKKLTSEEFKQFRKKVKTVVREEWGWNPHGWTPEIIFRFKDGRSVTRNPVTAKGQPPALISFEECIPKYQGCVRNILPDEQVIPSIDMLRELDSLDDVSDLIRLVTV